MIKLNLIDLNIQAAIETDSTRKIVEQLIQKDRAPHAILFSGVEGRGVFMEAFYYLLALMCTQSQNGVPCMSCKNCKRSQQWIHPDIHLTVPIFSRDKTTKDYLAEWRTFIANRDYFTFQQWLGVFKDAKNLNINNKEIENISHSFHLKPYEGDKKVFFIWGAEYLGIGGNKLLKIIEEPTDNTYFIFVTYQKNAILPTILSRVQHIDVPRASEASLIDYGLEQGLGTAHQVKEAVFLSEGNVADMLSILNNEESNYSEQLLSGLRLAIKYNGPGIIAWADQVQKMSNSAFTQFLQYHLHFIKEMIVGAHRENYVKKLLRNEQQAANWLLDRINVSELPHLVQKIDQYIASINQYANKKMLAVNLLLDYKEIIRK